MIKLIGIIQICIINYIYRFNIREQYFDLKEKLQTSENDVIRLQQLLNAHQKAHTLLENNKTNAEENYKLLQNKYDLLVHKFENEVKRVKTLQV